MSIAPEEFVHKWSVKEFYHLVRFLSWESYGQNEYQKLLALKHKS
jgi:hypothetical protein